MCMCVCVCVCVCVFMCQKSLERTLMSALNYLASDVIVDTYTLDRPGTCTSRVHKVQKNPSR